MDVKIIVREAECHPETCLDVEGIEGHTANVNPIGYSDDKWRVDCDDCGTCIRADLTKAHALVLAKAHVQNTSEQYWALRSQ